MSLNPLCGGNSVHWLKWKEPWSQVFLQWWPDVIMSCLICSPQSVSGCLMLAAWRVTGRLTCLTPQQGCATLEAWHITGRLTCLAGSLAHCQFSTPKCSTNAVLEVAMYRHIDEHPVSYSHSIRAPNSRSGGHKFESPVWQELGAVTKVERSVGSGLSSLHTIPFSWSRATSVSRIFIREGLYVLIKKGKIGST